MGVDGISGGGRPLHGVSVSELTATEVGSPTAAQGTGSTEGAASASGSVALKQLERGEINVEQYLDTRVAQAVQHLEGRLPASQIDFVRHTLREELSSDPVLVELVRRTTGSTPALETE